MAACVVVLGTGTAMAAPDPTLERAVKAAFLYKFLSYVEWPAATFADANAPYVIGVYGAEGIERELRTLAGSRSSAGRPLEVRTVRRGDALTGLQVLFVGSGETPLPAAMAAAVSQHPMLVISEGDRVPGIPSAIHMVVVDGRVRFDVNTASAERAGIKLSSRLLAVARSVRAGGE